MWTSSEPTLWIIWGDNFETNIGDNLVDTFWPFFIYFLNCQYQLFQKNQDFVTGSEKKNKYNFVNNLSWTSFESILRTFFGQYWDNFGDSFRDNLLRQVWELFGGQFVNFNDLVSSCRKTTILVSLKRKTNRISWTISLRNLQGQF